MQGYKNFGTTRFRLNATDVCEAKMDKTSEHLLFGQTRETKNSQEANECAFLLQEREREKRALNLRLRLTGDRL